jgi:hypothetical protein
MAGRCATRLARGTRAANADAEPGVTDNDVLDEVRRLLIDTLRRDTLPRPRAGAGARRAHAGGADHGISNASGKRTKRATANLQRARELLHRHTWSPDSLP